jgi:hypothetical protein
VDAPSAPSVRHETAEAALLAMLARLDEVPLPERMVKADIWRFSETAGGGWAYSFVTNRTYSSARTYDDATPASQTETVMAERRRKAVDAYTNRRDVTTGRGYETEATDGDT